MLWCYPTFINISVQNLSENGVKVSAHGGILARIGSVPYAPSNYAPITADITPALPKVNNTQICVDGVYFLRA